MMIAAALNRLDWRSLRPSKAVCLRALAAGAAWGLLLAAGLTAMSAWECGGICVEDVAITTATSVTAGIFGIGPLAAFARKRS